jgi:hypothetical protein
MQRLVLIAAIYVALTAGFVTRAAQHAGATPAARAAVATLQR